MFNTRSHSIQYGIEVVLTSLYPVRQVILKISLYYAKLVKYQLFNGGFHSNEDFKQNVYFFL